MSIEHNIPTKEREKIKIWMVDDNKEMFGVIQRRLKFEGLDIEYLPDGETLLERINKDEIPDIILLDDDLGEGHKRGAEIIEEIKQKIPQTKIIAHSSDEKSNQEMIERGADLSIKKGLEINKLIEYFVERNKFEINQ